MWCNFVPVAFSSHITIATLGPESDRPENFFVAHGRRMPETVPSLFVVWVASFVTPHFFSFPSHAERLSVLISDT
jgi:hypothetical protein